MSISTHVSSIIAFNIDSKYQDLILDFTYYIIQPSKYQSINQPLYLL